MSELRTKYMCSNTECNMGYGVKISYCRDCSAPVIENPNYGKKNNIKKHTNQRVSDIQGEYTKPVRMKDVKQVDFQRYSTGLPEFDRVLGSTEIFNDKGELIDTAWGLIHDDVIILTGDPGVGKSTLLLSVAEHVSKQREVLLILGEESESQVKRRNDRINKDGNNDFYVISEKNVEKIKDYIDEYNPGLVIIDSIQTLHSSNIDGIPGKPAQVEYAAQLLSDHAKKKKFTLIFIGHVNKDGEMAGTNTLKHLIDTAVHLEGDEYGEYRLIRSSKNRAAKVGEVGVLEMRKEGLVSVPDASNYFLREQSKQPGCALTCIFEGTRALMVELQTLSTPSLYSNPKRTSSGIDFTKLSVVSAIVQQHGGVFLQEDDIYFSVAGGLRIKDPSTDLPMALSIISAKKNMPIKPSTIILGELSLTGELRSVSQAEQRVQEAIKAKFKNVVIPSRQKLDLDDSHYGINIIRVRDLRDAVKKSLDTKKED